MPEFLHLPKFYKESHSRLRMMCLHSTKFILSKLVFEDPTSTQFRFILSRAILKFSSRSLEIALSDSMENRKNLV